MSAKGGNLEFPQEVWCFWASHSVMSPPRTELWCLTHSFFCCSVSPVNRSWQFWVYTNHVCGPFLKTVKGFSRVFLIPCNFHLISWLQNLSSMWCTASRFGVWAISLGFQPGVSVTKDFVRKQAVLHKGSQAHPWSWCHSRGKLAQLCNAAQVSGPQEPTFPILPVCVFMSLGTTLP